jgi:hypothetical protein
MPADSGVPQKVTRNPIGCRSAELNALYSHPELEVIREAVLRLPGSKVK